MKLSGSIFFFSAALAACTLAASAGPVKGADGMLRFPFGDTTPPSLSCAPLYVCDITLQPGERILNLAIGDSVRWVVAPATSGSGGITPHILIKPTDAGLATNLLVTTDKHTYEFDLHSSKNQPMRRVGFSYPADPASPAPTPHRRPRLHQCPKRRRAFPSKPRPKIPASRPTRSTSTITRAGRESCSPSGSTTTASTRICC
jgi:hypothetical protein